MYPIITERRRFSQIAQATQVIENALQEARRELQNFFYKRRNSKPLAEQSTAGRTQLVD